MKYVNIIGAEKREKDPINEKFDLLDEKAEELNDMYHQLKCEEMTLKRLRPTLNESFSPTYRAVRSNLSRRIQDASQRQREHERELERCTNQKKAVQLEIANRIGPLKSQLDNVRHQEGMLMQRKDELEKELANINVCLFVFFLILAQRLFFFTFFCFCLRFCGLFVFFLGSIE